ncbi:Nn.00g062770.m01.CDS01 [Neocucurbitaria sp. VM-36]
MLGFRPLAVGKRTSHAYHEAPLYDPDIEDGAYNEKGYDSDDGSYVSSPESSQYSSRQSSSSYDPNPNNIEARPLAPNASHQRAPSRPRVSAYSYRNPRACTRYFGLAVASTLLFFIWFLFHSSWESIRSAELGLHKQPPPPPVWESFPFLKRYHGGIRTLVKREKNVPEYPTTQDIDPEMPAQELKDAPKERRSQGAHIPDSVPFDPYPEYNDLSYVDKYGPVETCYLDANNTIQIPGVRAYKGVTDGMPENVMGSYSLLGLRDDVCFERFGRLGPYGMGYSKRRGGTGAGMEGDREGIDKVWSTNPEIDFRQVKWAEVLDRCLLKNNGRFQTQPKPSEPSFQTMAMQKRDTPLKTPSISGTSKAHANETVREQPKAAYNKLIPRTAVLIRTWSDYQYDDEDIMFLRALISELSIASGGEYHVHFLIHVKDDNKQIWADEKVYKEVLEKALPIEFAGMGTLWSERQMGLIYGGIEDSNYRGLPVHGAYRSTYMPVTYFAHQHPEFEYFWHWEMDVRYTGHYYHLFQQIAKWTDAQPRKGLWERNARFYVPSVHGPWEDFKHMVRVQTEHGTNNQANRWSSHLPPNPHVRETEVQKPEKPIWGPEPPQDYPDIEIDEAMKPNKSMIEDNYEWGVGEPADLIVFNPLFDPENTNWILGEDVTGYDKKNGLPPRRTAINTSGRLSRRLLETMHREQSHFRHTMFSEMWPATCALHHGLKAVYAPHPVFIDRKWPTQYLAAIFNNGRNGASGGARMSVFSDERQHNFLGTSWYFHAGFAPNLWKRWLGYKVDNDGGEEEELAGEGRMCLPAVLLHPVKQVDLIQERIDTTDGIAD